VTDITAYGTIEEAAQLLLPRGSTVLRARTLQEAVPPKITPLGTVDMPPKSYYMWVIGPSLVLVAADQT
jgi:hypothetical protein